MNYPSNIREEELKNKIATDFFGKYDCTEIIKDIDFAVKLKKPSLHDEYLLWAEAKAAPSDILAMLAQLVLTIGKARTFNKKLPPKFLGCFDCEKIAFIPYSEIQDIFHQNDFNWNVAPSNRDSKEFKQIYGQIDKIINNGEPYKTYCFNFNDENKLKLFILKNFLLGKNDISKIKIDKNNFISIYNKWLEAVKPTIQVSNWDMAKKNGIIDGDFYLADLLSAENKTLKEKLFVVLRQTHYEMNRHTDELGFFTSSSVEFSDKQKAHNAFWAVYERPPREDYWDYIIERRDLLVPQDVRERKGSFFTPQIWVELSQKYIADVFGEDWQEEYYVWDCAAGTGNLLTGLTNKYKIWASTLDKADVDVMHDRIKNGANLLEDHCFQFDFLNDGFDKLPKGLRDIIEKTPEKLIVYINPPYAEAGNKETISGTGFNKSKVSASKIYDDFKGKIGNSILELSAQFMLRIYRDIPNAKLATFSTVKYICSSNFISFREYFMADYKKGFICEANTFDNVKGEFPISFFIWNLENKQKINSVLTDVYITDNDQITYQQNSVKYFYAPNKGQLSIDWLRKYFDKEGKSIAYLRLHRNDIQNKSAVFITSKPSESDFIKHEVANVTEKNIIEMAIYCTIRQVIEATWLNNKDNFQYPNDKWETDAEFQNDCLANVLFDNNVQSAHGTNHWIPFTETEVNARDKFESNFMTDFIKGKIKIETNENLFENKKTGQMAALVFSPEAKIVFDCGQKLWKYYHSKPKVNVNASYYDIREFFQGRNDKGKMNAKSEDETYNELISDLRSALKILAKKIEPKIYEYGFLRK